MGGQLSRHSPTASSPRPAPRRVIRTASSASKARSPPSPPTPPSRMAITPTQPTKGIEAFALIWTAWLFSQEWWREELWREGANPARRSKRRSTTTAPISFPARDANDIILQSPHMGAPRCRNDTRLRRRHRTRPPRRSKCRSSICHPKPTYISRSATPAYESQFIPNVTSSRSPPSGVTPPALPAIPPTPNS